MKNKLLIIASVSLSTAALCYPEVMPEARADTAHLKPDPVCVPVGVKLQLGLTGAKFKGAGDVYKRQLGDGWFWMCSS